MKSGGHKDSQPGVILAAGPDIRRSGVALPIGELTKDRLPSLGSVNDLTPTILALLDLPAGRDMDGRVLTEMIAKPYLQAHPVRYVETHTPAGWFEARSAEVERPASEERIEQLRALGYLDDDAEE